VERAQLECKLAAASLGPLDEERQKTRDCLEHALQRLGDCVIRGIIPADIL
jgi:hypothetical protein